MERTTSLVRVMVADDQPMVRFALRVLLERQPGVRVVGEAADAQSLLAQIPVLEPHLVLLDWELPGLSRLRLLVSLREAHPDLWVIALSGHPEARQDSLATGANAFVSKTDPPERLLATIGRTVQAGRPGSQ